MKIKVLAASIMLISSAQSFAGIPEFDAVGQDFANIFNDQIRQSVVLFNNSNGLLLGTPINGYADWVYYGAAYDADSMYNNKGREGFWSTGSQGIDPCYNEHDIAVFGGPFGPFIDTIGSNYTSYYAGPRNTNQFHWDIVLQMKPESDLDIKIRDCVLNGFSVGVPMFESTQTGRFRQSNGRLMFRPSMNPQITVEAISGPKHPQPFQYIMDSRGMPGLGVVSLDHVRYTSKGPWQEDIIVAMPEDGESTTAGSSTVRLREGDVIRVTVDIPGRNANDIFYGNDNVSIEYIGERRTIYMDGTQSFGFPHPATPIPVI